MLHLQAYGGSDAGKLELHKTPLPDAIKYATELFISEGKDLDKELPQFADNYIRVQNLSQRGHTKRKDMPVIDTKDIKRFQKRIKNGFIDIVDPHPHDELHLEIDPFPVRLSGNQAKKWLQDGLKRNDGDAHDDKVNVKLETIPVGLLRPIQQQIYFDKSIANIAKDGSKGSRKFLGGDSVFIASADHKIIDGHHRFLTGMLIDPSIKVKVLVIDLPISKLLPLAVAYGDSIGNERNK